jgi:hypothetical protein
VCAADLMPTRPRIRPPVGKVRPRNDVDQLVDGDRRIVDHRHAGVDHLAQIVRGHVGGHAHGDAAGAVDQQIGEARGQNRRLALGIVVVGLELDRVLVDVLEQRMRHLGHAGLGVAHGRRGIAVDRAEIALPVDQRQPEGEFLRHAHQRVIDRLVAMRVILADDVAHDAGGLAVRLVPVIAVLVHREQDAPVHGLQPVADVGKGAAHDHAHGVIEVALAHLLLDGDHRNFGRIGGRHCAPLVVGIGHGKPVKNVR